jgi:parallel beta-helix repeat protein
VNFLHYPSYFFKITKTCNYLTFSILGLTTASVLCSASLVLAQPLKSGEVVAQVPTSANKLFVNPAGTATGNGSEAAPFKTITQALQVAGENSVIVLASGTYSAESGETFPLVLKSGVSIQGNAQTKGKDIVIKGGGAYMSRTFARQDITILGANNAAISGVTVTNANPRGYGLWIESSSPTVSDNTFTGNNHDGISITGSSAPKIRSNYFYLNGANGITIYGTSTPEIQENVFEKTGFGINIAQKAAPLLTNNRIVQNRSGIITQASARPVLRGNIIEGNTEDGLVAIAMSQPDLGTTAAPGKNVFRQNGRFDINTSASKQTLTAFGNQLGSDRISGNLDLSGTVNPNQPQIAQNVPNVSTQPIKPVITPIASRTTSQLPAPPLGNSQPLRTTSQLPPPVLGNGQTPKTTTSQLPSVLGNGQIPKTTATPNRNVAATEGIDIIVPPPENSNNIKTIQVATNVSQGSDTAANIPQVDVPPPPISGQINPPATIDKNLPVLQSAQIVEAELLPVPGGNIPVGNSRKLPKVPVRQNPSPSEGSPPLPPTQATSLGLRYRVIVAADSQSKQERVKSLVPGAFRTFNNGKVLMQVGAFSDRAKAMEMQQYLSSQGVTGTIEQLN